MHLDRFMHFRLKVVGVACFSCKTGYGSELENADETATTTLQ